MVQPSKLHDDIFKLLVNEGANEAEAVMALTHVILNLGVMSVESDVEPTTFKRMGNNEPCFSARSYCKTLTVNILSVDPLLH